MPDANGQLTDQERLDLYNKCQAAIPFDVVGALKFVAGIIDGDLPAVLKPFADGIGQKGCDVFLTQAQIDARNSRQFQQDHGGANRPIGGAGH